MDSSPHDAERDQSSSPEPIIPPSPTPPLPGSLPQLIQSTNSIEKTARGNRSRPLFSSRRRQRSSGQNINNETIHLAQTSKAINREEGYKSQTPDMNKITLKVVGGNLDEVTQDWSLEELQDSRRIVAFQKILSKSTLDISFNAVTAENMRPDGFYISCIKRDDIGNYYFIQEDMIRFIAWLLTWSHTEPFPYNLSAEEKNQILQTLEDFNPLILSKVKTETEDFFKLIMGLPHPQPSDFDIQIEVHRWETLLPALNTIIDKYSAYLKSYKQSIEAAEREHVSIGWIDTKPFSSQFSAKTAYKPEEMSADKRQRYISELADSFAGIIKNLHTDEEALQRVSDVLPTLLEAFALRIGHEAATRTHHNIMNFIFENRHQISTSVKNKLSEPRNLQAENFPSSNNTSIDDTVGAWLSNLNLSQTQSMENEGNASDDNQNDDVDSANINIDSPKDDSGDTILSKLQEAPDLWLSAYYDLIPQTGGYQWLLSRLKKEVFMAPAKPSFMSTINNLITQSLQSSFHTPAKIYNAEFEVDWDIMAFLEKEEYSTKLHETVERVITVTGSYQDAYITTCEQYLDQTWPLSGRIMMQLVKDMADDKIGLQVQTDSSTGTRIRASIDGSKLIVAAEGLLTSVVEVGEQLAWLGAALRTPPHDQGLACCSPFISASAAGAGQLLLKLSTVQFKIRFKDEIQQDPSLSNGKCWHNLFKNPMVVKGYPIPTRVETGTGAEMPINIMAGLARTPRVDCFKGMTFIKGFSTLLVPTRRSGDMIFWHLFYKKDGRRISYLDSDIASLGYAKNLDLEQCRHVLGWCENAEFYAGSAQANYFVMNSALPAPHEGCSLAGTYVSPGRCIVGGPAFSLGAKDTPVHVSRSGYIPRLQWIATKYVLLWDESEKRGWLVNGTSALLHIVRASLAYNNTDKFNFAFIFRKSAFQESATLFTADSAIDMLINPKNLALKLYREKDGFLLLESRIEYFYNILEKLIDHQADIAGERGVNMADKPRRYLEGWEFNDLAMSRDPLYPRVASLEPRGKSWVDFIRATHAVTLFGRGFGDIIKSSTGADVCEYWAEMPKQKYYLAACLSDMSQLVKDNHTYEESQVRVSQDIIWHTPTSLFGTCRCKGILGQDHSDPVQSLLPAAMSKILLPRKLDIPLESPGAIIFGHNSSFSWIYEDSGYPTEGKLPPLNVSDVDSLKDSGIGVDMDSPIIGATQSGAHRLIRFPTPGQVEASLLESPYLLSSESHSQEDYTVGILCALPKELLAVRALFDKKHDNPESIFGDSNHYALGQMGKHMIVASCLPEYGTTSAADSASNMRRSFSSIKFCLIVGIGGGAPSEENDIRLGDVVVSLPTAGYPGVVQYDRGKEKDNNVFELTGSLPPPPRSLMTAISSLRSDPDLPSYPLQPYLDEIINRVPESMRWRYKHPGKEHDQLLKAACPKCQMQEECANSDSHITQRRQRQTDHPEIHYGLIASGNHVIKNSQTRDKWAQEHAVLCFEMEAAGIMNIFPSLVIRGICDYADAFKNKLWQEYAAAAAAAYAKLLLGVVASADKSHDVLSLGRRKSSVSERPDELHHKRRRLE
ncbi:hypothetical protein ACQKWADRAFT_117177 [Trichoderma austrokoningii]